MKLHILVLTYLFTLISCVAKNKDQHDNKPQQNTPTDTTTNRLQLYDLHNDNGVDTNNYAGYSYWNDSLMTRFKSKYIDTFSIDNQQFRIIDTYGDDTTLSNYVKLQQKINGKWYIQKNIFTPWLHCGDVYLKDVNFDGYKDLCQCIRFTSDIMFYNKEKRQYNDTVDTYIHEIGPKIVDRTRSIFCDFQYLKGMEGQIGSNLFKIENYKRIDLFRMEFSTEDRFMNTNSLDSPIDRFYLYKILDQSQYSMDSIDVIKIKKIKDADYLDQKFDYVGYWKKNYKKLLQLK